MKYLMERVHLIGIGGSGLSAIARVLLESGVTVSGSDQALTPFLASVQAMGARVQIGHIPDLVLKADLVVRSSAISDDNPEVVAARRAGIPVLKRGDFLESILEVRYGIGIAGTHGKTTTTAMIAWMLTRLGQDPGYIVGSEVMNLHRNAHAGTGKPFVIEADEYDRMFLGLPLKIAIVTNVDYDHPDCYPTPESYGQAFLSFARQLQKDGVLLACEDNPGSVRLLAAEQIGANRFGYGVPPAALAPSREAGATRWAYQALGLAQSSRGGYRFEFYPALQGANVSRQLVELQVPGEHNVRNALVALAVADRLGLPLPEAAHALGEYQGTQRRFEVRGEASGVIVIDDYAHHPAEIRATLSAARSRFPGRGLWAVWQPHTYSRTQALADEFAAAFDQADHVVVTEVYAAREARRTDFSSRQVVSKLHHPDAHYSPDLAHAASTLLGRLVPGDIVLVLSAGDADQISTHVLAALQERSHTDEQSEN